MTKPPLKVVASIEDTDAKRPDTKKARTRRRPAAPDFFAPTERGTAEAIACLFKRSLRWCEERNVWLVSDRKKGVWVEDKLHDYRRKAMEAAAKQKEAHPKSKVHFESVRHTNDALTLAKPRLAVLLKDFDADPWALNTPKGVVDLRTGVMRSWTSDDLFLRQTRIAPAAEWDPKETPLWIAHLQRMTHGNAEQMELLRVLAGMSLIGSQNLKPHYAPHLNGLGRNGKGAFLQTLVHGLGDYATFASTRLLTAREDAHTTDQADLEGKRLVAMEEVRRVNASLFKDITGGGYLRARKVYRDNRPFLKTWTLWFNNNGPLLFTGDTSDGLWSRPLRIDFGAGLTADEQDSKHAERLKDETAGVLAWALLGCAEFLQHGVKVPASVQEASDERRMDADPLGTFLTEHFVRDEGAKMILGSMFVQMYTEWAKEHGEVGGGMKAIYADLRDRFQLPVRAATGNKTYIFGLRPCDQTRPEWRQPT